MEIALLFKENFSALADKIVDCVTLDGKYSVEIEDQDIAPVRYNNKVYLAKLVSGYTYDEDDGDYDKPVEIEAKNLVTRCTYLQLYDSNEDKEQEYEAPYDVLEAVLFDGYSLTTWDTWEKHKIPLQMTVVAVFGGTPMWLDIHGTFNKEEMLLEDCWINDVMKQTDAVFPSMETFSGHRLGTEDVIRGILSAYFNNCTSMGFHYVTNELYDIKKNLMKDSIHSDCGRDIPMRFLHHSDLVPLGLATEMYSFYSDGDHFIAVDTPTGTVLTDYENFFMNLYEESIKRIEAGEEKKYYDANI